MALWLCLLLVGPAQAAEPALPLPRFASLKTDEVLLRAGPGTAYPVEWIFRRQGLPVLITAEYGTWRRVRDMDGSEGWIHVSRLSSSPRHALLLGEMTLPLLAQANAAAAAVAMISPGAIGSVRRCLPDWCELAFAGARGWLPRPALFGVLADETID